MRPLSFNLQGFRISVNSVSEDGANGLSNRAMAGVNHLQSSDTYQLLQSNLAVAAASAIGASEGLVAKPLEVLIPVLLEANVFSFGRAVPHFRICSQVSRLLFGVKNHLP